MRMTFGRAGLFAALAFSMTTGAAARAAAPPVVVDFTRRETAEAWRPVQDITAARATPDGLEVRLAGADPFLTGPMIDLPPGVPLRVRARLRSEQGGTAQLFYFRQGPREEESVRFAVKAGEWQEPVANLPPLGPGYRLRFDPPGSGGTVVIASLTFEPFAPLPMPAWPAVVPPRPRPDAPAIDAGDLRVVHDGETFGSFDVRVGGQSMVIGLSPARVGYEVNGEVRWADIAGKSVVSRTPAGAVEESVRFRDADGATWDFRRSFHAAGDPHDAIKVETRVEVDHDRDVVFLPMLVLLPGANSFGASKAQALLPGLEYLDDEPSSSEADIIGPGARRLLPDPVKLTFPLMAVAAKDRYIGVVWDRGDAPYRSPFGAVFDSPDRTFGGGGHATGLVFPGYDPDRRIDGHLMPVKPTTLRAGQALILSATIIGGRGASVVPAIQQYVKLRGLPPAPGAADEAAAQAYFATAAAGWLDSSARVGDLYRHATPGSFAPQPAADAAVFQDWLAGQVENEATATALRTAAAAAIARVGPAGYGSAAVGHVRDPLAPLVYGHVAENADRAAAAGRALVARFEPDGSLRYKPPAKGVDLGRTHFAQDANGLTATSVAAVLEHAAFSGDPDLLRDGLRLLRAMDKFKGGVPRGAQTWEVPLHTPDVLASAKLARAYTLGYELTGDATLLDAARYWAWTGVPFVYLERPTDGPVGLYASTSVFGATQWQAPNWMGQPVQWTALVYADALYKLAPHDPSGPWRQLADGITASGVQQTAPRSGRADVQGLLPDSFVLRAQQGQEPFINPGTLQPDAARLYRGAGLYSFHSFRAGGLLVHAPGALADTKDEPGGVSFVARGWPTKSYYVLVNGVKVQPRVTIGGKDVALVEPHQFDETKGRLVLRLEGQPAVTIRTGAR